MKFIFIPFLFLTFFVHAQDQTPEITLTVSDKNFNSSSYQVITQEEIQNSQSGHLADLLFQKTNLNLSQSTYEPTSIFIRGGDSSHILFLLDGVPLYDPSTIQKTTDLSLIQLSAIKKIEIIKGSQSVLYGGQALIAVVKIFTDFTPQKDIQIKALTNGYWRSLSAFKSMHINESQNAVIGAAILNGHNQSPLKNSDAVYSTQDYQMQLSHLYDAESFNLVSKLQLEKQKQNIPNINDLTSKPVDTDSYQTEQEYRKMQLLLRSNQNIDFSLSYSENSRQYDIDQAQNFNGYAIHDKYKGQLTSMRVDAQVLQNKVIEIKSGAAFENEGFKYIDKDIEKNNEKSNFEGVYLKSEYFVNGESSLETGFRLDFEKSKYLETTYQLGLNFNQYVKYEFATGFKNGSLYQKYGSYGNPNLLPELARTQALTWQSLKNAQTQQSITLFQTEFKNLIDTDKSTQRYININKAKSTGIEYQMSFKDFLSLSWTYQEPIDQDTHQWLNKRSLFTSYIEFKHQYHKFMNSLSYKYVSSSDVKYFESSANKVTRLPAYSVVRLSSDYEYNQSSKVFLSVDNILNEKYQTNYEYYNQGIGFIAGLVFKL